MDSENSTNSPSSSSMDNGTVLDDAALRAALEAYNATAATAVESTSRENTEHVDTTSDEPRSPTSEELLTALASLRADLDEQRNLLLRSRADFENLKRRHANELEKAHKYALDNFVRELLPVRDSLELGQSAAQDDGADLTRLREGTSLTLKLLQDAMDKFGVLAVEPIDQTFDPAFHQAISMQPRADLPPNTIVAVIQKGYTLNGRLVRPALVLVSQTPDL